MDLRNKIIKIRYIVGIGAVAAGVTLASLAGCSNNVSQEDFDNFLATRTAENSQQKGELAATITPLQTTTADNSRQIEELATKTAPYDGRITALEGTITPLQTITADTYEQVQDLATQMPPLQTITADTYEQVQDLATKTAPYDGRITALEGTANLGSILDNIESRLIEHNSSFEAYKLQSLSDNRELSTAVTEGFQNRLDRLYDNVRTAHSENRDLTSEEIDELQKEVEDIGKDIERLRTDPPRDFRLHHDRTPHPASSLSEILDARVYGVNKIVVAGMYRENVGGFPFSRQPHLWNGSSIDGELQRNGLRVNEFTLRGTYSIFDNTTTRTSTHPISELAVHRAFEAYFDRHPGDVSLVTVITHGPNFVGR